MVPLMTSFTVRWKVAEGGEGRRVMGRGVSCDSNPSIRSGMTAGSKQPPKRRGNGLTLYSGY